MLQSLMSLWKATLALISSTLLSRDWTFASSILGSGGRCARLWSPTRPLRLPLLRRRCLGSALGLDPLSWVVVQTEDPLRESRIPGRNVVGLQGSETTTPGRKSQSAVTGSARKVKDNAADWHNLILKWDRLNDEGSTMANKIVNLGFNKSSQKEMQVMMAGQDTSASSNSENAFENSRELEEECDKLLSVVDKMTRIVSKMEKLVSSEKGIIDLETFQYGTGGRQTPLFQTWPTSQFDVSNKLYEAYKQELTLKRAILQELAHTTNPDLSMVYLSCWLYQPYTDDRAKLLLEGLLLETGHRPI